MNRSSADWMRSDSFAVFRDAAVAAGFDEALIRDWASGQIVEAHAHPFDAEAVVVEGEMWLSDGENTRHLLPGDTFALPKGTSHSERYGPTGATYWVARRG
ncbi:MAG: cupin domain-containing protein [Variovorax sp.]